MTREEEKLVLINPPVFGKRLLGSKEANNISYKKKRESNHLYTQNCLK